MKDIYRVGDSLEDGDLEIALIWQSGDYVEESEYQQPAAGYKYIYLQFAFRNIGMKRDCPTLSVCLQLFCGQHCYSGLLRRPRRSLPPSCRQDAMPSWQSPCFCVPEDAQQIEVEYQPDQLTKRSGPFCLRREKNAGIVPM